MATLAVEVVYRGIFQKTLARNIVRHIVFAARKDGKIGTAFGRYGDSPERNGIPAKQFAIVADTALELEESMAVYEATAVDVTINVDDTMCKGIESWAWYGLQPINELTKPGGTLGTNLDTDNFGETEDNAEPATAPDYTTGTVSIGDVTVNARQSDKSTDVSGVDNINGTAASGFEGLGILSGVRASTGVGQVGNLITLNSTGGSVVYNITEIDEDLAGNIGDILIRSDNSVAFRSDTIVGTFRGVTGDLSTGIFASGETGLIQLDPGLDTVDQVVILGDENATADNTVATLAGAGANEIVVVIV